MRPYFTGTNRLPGAVCAVTVMYGGLLSQFDIHTARTEHILYNAQTRLQHRAVVKKVLTYVFLVLCDFFKK